MEKGIRHFIKLFLPRFIIDKYRTYQSKKINYFDDNNFIEYVYKKKYGLLNHANEIETLAIRGSNTDYGFYPYIIKNSYNLGLISSDLYFNYFLYSNVSKILPKLRNIVYFYNVPANGMSLIKIIERYRLVAYKYYFNVEYQESDIIDKKIEKKIFKKCKKYNKDISKDFFGYETKTAFLNVTPETRAKQLLRENQREPDQINWLKEIIIKTEQDNVNLIIVIPPHLNDFKINLPDSNILFRKLYDLIDEFNSVTLIDFYNSDKFSDLDMGDSDHLNEKGAKKITEEISKIMKSKGFIQNV